MRINSAKKSLAGSKGFFTFVICLLFYLFELVYLLFVSDFLHGNIAHKIRFKFDAIFFGTRENIYFHV